MADRGSFGFAPRLGSLLRVSISPYLVFLLSSFPCFFLTPFSCLDLIIIGFLYCHRLFLRLRHFSEGKDSSLLNYD